MLGFPLFIPGRTLGALDLYSSQPESFDTDAERIGELTLNQLSGPLPFVESWRPGLRSGGGHLRLRLQSPRQPLLDSGHMVIFGPVLDTTGS